MVANVGPADYNYDESLSTLRYAHRAKSIKNKPKINDEPKDAMIREYQQQIQYLRAQLAQRSVLAQLRYLPVQSRTLWRRKLWRKSSSRN